MTRINSIILYYSGRSCTTELNALYNPPGWIEVDSISLVSKYIQLGHYRYLGESEGVGVYFYGQAKPGDISVRLSIMELGNPNTSPWSVPNPTGIFVPDISAILQEVDEGDCRCDIRALMSSGHEPNCNYISRRKA